MISFIVPAHNEELLLGQSLQSIVQSALATGRPYELIVVDDTSTDRTAAIAAAAGARVVSVSLRHIAAVRNAGAAVASGDVLIFVDADTIIPEATLREVLAAIDGGAVGGGAEVGFEGHIPWAMWLYIVGFMFVWRRLRLAAGCFLFATRTAFDAAGGWDETYFAGEEMYLSRALKRRGRFVIVKEPVVSSSRKARLYSGWELTRISVGLLLRGPKAWQRREGLEMWYEGRREDA